MSGAREGPPSATLFGEPFANAGLRRPPSVEGDQSGTLLVHRNVASLRGPEEAALFADISGKRPHASAEGEELRPSSAGPSAEDWASNSHGEGKASEERTLEAAFPWPHSPPSASVRVAGGPASSVSAFAALFHRTNSFNSREARERCLRCLYSPNPTHPRTADSARPCRAAFERHDVATTEAAVLFK